MEVDISGVARPGSVPVRPPLEWGREGFKVNRILFSYLQKLTVEHVGDGLGVDRARTVTVCMPPGLRRYPQKVSGYHPAHQGENPREPRGGRSSAIARGTTRDQQSTSEKFLAPPT